MRKTFVEFLTEADSKKSLTPKTDEFLQGHFGTANGIPKSETPGIKTPEEESWGSWLGKTTFDSKTDNSEDFFNASAGKSTAARSALVGSAAISLLATGLGFANTRKGIARGFAGFGLDHLKKLAAPPVTPDNIQTYIKGAGAAQVNLRNWNRGLDPISVNPNFWAFAQQRNFNTPQRYKP